MVHRLKRRTFLKQGATTLLATSIWPSFSAEGDAFQQPLRPAPPGEPPIPSPPPINKLSTHQVLERATYVCGRGEVENYFRSADKPEGFEQNLETYCQLRTRTPYDAIKQLEAYISAAQQHMDRRDIQEAVLRARYILGQIHSFLGNLEKAVEQFQADQKLALSLGFKDQARALEKILGITRFRRGQVENWVAHHNPQSSIFPLPPEARFNESLQAEESIKNFLQYLEDEPRDLEEEWLLNLAFMSLGKYPEGVPQKHRIPLAAFESKDSLGRFVDIAPELGVNVFAAAGSVVMDDFDNDGFLDLMISTGDHCQPLYYFHNNGNGTFEDRSAPARLSNLFGGFSIFQADYNNDGWMDLYVARGAWETPVRHSLLRNNGDGTFTDVTIAAGINLLPPVASQAVAWADYDNDGNVDFFVGAENGPAHLFHNNGDGTFTDVSHRAGVDRTAFTKGAIWGDYDNDGYPELYVSNEGEENWLYHYNGDGTFTEIARTMHVETPLWSFPVWFWDYDNDGWLDLYVSSHYESVSHVIRSYLHQPTAVEVHALYRNGRGKAFENVTRQVGLDVVTMTMGANFGDVDNDGWLDFYLGTGAPSYAALVPNMMFRNEEGKRFVDITASSGTGSLQKGHGVAIGNLFNDGQPALYAQLGGMVPGDRYYSALFKSPSSGNNWIDIKLVGVKTNRAAIGVRVKLTVEDGTHGRRDVHRHVCSGGSFGSSPLRQLIGVGKATRIETLEIWWPTSQTRQTFHNVGVNQCLEVKEFARDYAPLEVRPTKPGSAR